MTHYNALKPVGRYLGAMLMKKVCNKVNRDIWDITQIYPLPLFDDMYAMLHDNISEPMTDQIQTLALRPPK